MAISGNGIGCERCASCKPFSRCHLEKRHPLSPADAIDAQFKIAPSSTFGFASHSLRCGVSAFPYLLTCKGKLEPVHPAAPVNAHFFTFLRPEIFLKRRPTLS